MTVVQWRQFTFFECEQVLDTAENADSPQWLQV